MSWIYLLVPYISLNSIFPWRNLTMKPVVLQFKTDYIFCPWSLVLVRSRSEQVCATHSWLDLIAAGECKQPNDSPWPGCKEFPLVRVQRVAVNIEKRITPNSEPTLMTLELTRRDLPSLARCHLQRLQLWQCFSRGCANCKQLKPKPDSVDIYIWYDMIYIRAGFNT